MVFDTLSYSAGPLPEQLLAEERLKDLVVWVCLGLEDPWTPRERVRRLEDYAPVRRVDFLPGAAEMERGGEGSIGFGPFWRFWGGFYSFCLDK